MRKVPVVTFVDIDDIPPPRGEGRSGMADLLETLAQERITLVFSSHRTRAQVESVRQAFGVFHPFVCEGGGAAFVPERYFGTELEDARSVGGYQAVEFASPYDDVVDAVRRTADRLGVGILGFNDMSVEQVARECGFSLLEARLAKLREYSEPFRLLCANPIAERRLLRALAGAGVTCRAAGGFHCASTSPGMQAAAAYLTKRYATAFGSVMTAASTSGHADAFNADVRLDTCPVNREDPLAARGWIESVVRQIESVRDARESVRAARLAR